jgi:hypothetical protein
LNPAVKSPSYALNFSHSWLVWTIFLQNTCPFLSYFLVTFTEHLILSSHVTELWKIKDGKNPTPTRNVSKKDKIMYIGDA